MAEMPLLHAAAAKQDDFQIEECLRTPRSLSRYARVQIHLQSLHLSHQFHCQVTDYLACPMCTYNEIWIDRLSWSLLFLFQRDF